MLAKFRTSKTSMRTLYQYLQKLAVEEFGCLGEGGGDLFSQIALSVMRGMDKGIIVRKGVVK